MKGPTVVALESTGQLKGGSRAEDRRPRIAICDYIVSARSPIGSCHIALMQSLCESIDFTVFAADFVNPRPDRIRFVKVPVPTRPLALLYLAYHLAVLPVFFWTTRVRGAQFDLVQSAETYSLLGEISYSHFCHRCYLREHSRTTPVKSLGSLFRWLDHRVRALTEGFVYRRARAIVTPSAGLKRELSRELSLPGSKITVIGNPVDLERFARPTDFDGDAFRQQYGISGRDVVATFTALGHFERKGLPFIFEAMRTLQRPDFKLLIVGGRESLIAEYRRKAEKLGIIESIIFAGMQNDVRPFLWCSDLFLFPSLYEVFPLVVLQTAASGLPILSSKVNGVEEFLVDEENGLYIDASTAGVERGLEKFFSLTPTARLRMGQSARASVAGYSNEHFGRQWARFYAGLELAKGRVWSGRAESSLAKEL